MSEVQSSELMLHVLSLATAPAMPFPKQCLMLNGLLAAIPNLRRENSSMRCGIGSAGDLPSCSELLSPPSRY